MLKLEKRATNREVSISLRGKEKLLSGSFLRALAIAFALHFVGFVIFQVSPFKIKSVETIYPPVMVNTDLGPLFDSAVLTHLDEGRGRAPKMIIPKPSTPRLPQIPISETYNDFIYSRHGSEWVDPFKEHDLNLEKLDLIPLETLRYIDQQAEIRISGGLADRKRIDSVALSYNYQAVFRVKVDDSTGHIFWFEKISGEDYPDTEKILSGLQFEEDTSGFVTEGQVEFVLISPHKEARE